MRSEELTRELVALEDQHAALVKELDELIASYRPHLAEIAEKWIKAELDQRIRDHADVVAAFGIEKVRTLKSRVQALIASLPKIAEEETSDRIDWPHCRPIDTTGYGHGKNEPFFNKALRNVFSHIGAVLDEFGLLIERNGDVPCWKRVSNGRFRFGCAINPGFDDLECEALTKYTDAKRKYDALAGQIAAKKQELVQEKAKEMWNSA